MNSSSHKIAIFCLNYEGKCYCHEFWTPWMCGFCSVHGNWYPWKLRHPQYTCIRQNSQRHPKQFFFFVAGTFIFYKHLVEPWNLIFFNRRWFAMVNTHTYTVRCWCTYCHRSPREVQIFVGCVRNSRKVLMKGEVWYRQRGGSNIRRLCQELQKSANERWGLM